MARQLSLQVQFRGEPTEDGWNLGGAASAVWVIISLEKFLKGEK